MHTVVAIDQAFKNSSVTRGVVLFEDARICMKYKGGMHAMGNCA